MLIADVALACTGDLKFGLMWANGVVFEWLARSTKTGQFAGTNSRGMVEQPVQHCDAVAKVSLEKRHERTAVPCGERHQEASSMVTANPIVVEPGTIGFVIEVVRLDELGQKPVAMAGERLAGEGFLHSRGEPRRCVACDSTKDRLAAVAKIWAEQCQQFKNDSVFDLAGNAGSLSAAPASVADLREGFAQHLRQPTLPIDFLWSACGVSRSFGLLLLGEATIS